MNTNMVNIKLDIFENTDEENLQPFPSIYSIFVSAPRKFAFQYEIVRALDVIGVGYSWGVRIIN